MKVWVGPDGVRYTVSLIREPGDAMQSLVFQADGWLGVIGVPATIEGADLIADALIPALERARVG